MHFVPASLLIPTGSDGNAAGPVATPSTGARDVSVIRQRQMPGGSGPEHHHDREEVLVPLRGEIAVHVLGARHVLTAGEAVIVPANLRHRVETLEDTLAEWLLVAPAGVRFFGADGQPVSPAWAG